MSTSWPIGGKMYCLNQASRPDRWAQAQSEFSRVGIAPERFLSIPAENPHESFCISQYAMLKAFLKSDEHMLTTFEDDVAFRNLDHLKYAMCELPMDFDFDVLYLGANITDGVFGIKENPPERYTQHLWRVRRAWTTHAVVYSREMARIIAAFYKPGHDGMYDNWLSETVLPNFNCYLVNPMICYQRPGRSDLWGNDTDYTGAFEWGDKFMKA